MRCVLERGFMASGVTTSAVAKPTAAVLKEAERGASMFRKGVAAGMWDAISLPSLRPPCRSSRAHPVERTDVYSDAANLNQKREQREKTHAENPFQAAIDAAEMGTWSWDIPSGRVEWTPRTYQLFGFEPGAFATSYDSFMKIVHEEDRPAVVRWCAHAVRERSRMAIEYRIVRGDGAVRWVRSTGRAMSDEGGRSVRMVGVVD